MTACFQVLHFYTFKVCLGAVHLSAGETSQAFAGVVVSSDAEVTTPARDCHVMVWNAFFPPLQSRSFEQRCGV
uniref:Putative secreted protein n=1 Tax=Rhipicephalus microplus TaxID=6941 RepID=A0A6G5A2A3_RHIMP